MAAAPKIPLTEVQKLLDEEKHPASQLGRPISPFINVSGRSSEWVPSAPAIYKFVSETLMPLTDAEVSNLCAPVQTTSRGDDFQAWLVDQANALHAHQYYWLDCDALAEELEDMAARDKRELRTRLRNLLLHLLKWKYQSARRTSSWRRTVNNERDEIEDFLKYSPSLATELSLSFDEMYKRARRDASDFLKGAAKVALPDASPWSLETVRDPTFWPEPDPASGPTVPHC